MMKNKPTYKWLKYKTHNKKQGINKEKNPKDILEMDPYESKVVLFVAYQISMTFFGKI